MRIYPAIDLRGGKCVRLRQGDYAQETIFGEDPAAMAMHWESLGAEFLHLVDLDGARDGRMANLPAVQEILSCVRIPCQLGGGIRDDTAVAELLMLGVQRVVVGTRALEDPDWLRAQSRRFPDRIVVSIDARDGKVAVRGWEEVFEQSVDKVLERLEGFPLGALVYTDIARDGMMQGPNVEAISRMVSATSLPVIASGGVSSVGDVERLAKLGLEGCIIGRALYEGAMTLAEAQRAAEG